MEKKLLEEFEIFLSEIEVKISDENTKELIDIYLDNFDLRPEKMEVEDYILSHYDESIKIIKRNFIK